MGHHFRGTLEKNPVIAAVKNREELERALRSSVEIIFLLGGNICEMEEMVSATRERGKALYVHIDLMEGVGRDAYAIRYFKRQIDPDGILTTKPNFVRYARACDLFVIQRMFILDSRSLENVERAVVGMEAHAVELLPGIIPSVIPQICQRAKIPVIAGGLICTKQEAIECLSAGAMGVSTSNPKLWEM